MGWPQAAPAEPVMADESDRITVMHQRVIAGDFFVDRDQYLFFANELEQVPELYTLALDHLPHRHWRSQFTGDVSLAVGRLELSHKGYGHHIAYQLSVKPG